MRKAVDFEILRSVECNSRIRIPLARKPVSVATLLDEAAFNRDHCMAHNVTVFYEDRWHDWDWSDGQFQYYAHSAAVGERADVLVVYAYEEMDPPTRTA